MGKYIMYEYFYLTYNINTKDCVEQTNTIEKIFSCGDSIVSIIVEIILAIVGVCGIRYLYKIREKNYNATFGFYCRLKVRLCRIIKIINKDYKDYIFDRFSQQNSRKDIDLKNAENIKIDIEDLAETAKETLEFLKKEDNQMPASENWSNNYSTLLDFLEDCKNISDENYYKWQSSDSNMKDTYYKLHNDNLHSMLEYINDRQNYLQKKLYKKSWLYRFLFFIKNKIILSKKT